MASVGRNVWEGAQAAFGRWGARIGPGLNTYAAAAGIGASAGAALSLATRDDLKDKILGVPIYAGLGAAAGIGLAAGMPKFAAATGNVRHTLDLVSRGVDVKDPAALKDFLAQIESDPKITPKNKAILREAYGAKGVAPDINYARMPKTDVATLQENSFGIVKDVLNERHYGEMDADLVGSAVRDDVPRWLAEGLSRDEVYPWAKEAGREAKLGELERARRELIDVPMEMSVWDYIGRFDRRKLSALAGMTELDRFSPQAKAIDFLRDTWFRPPEPGKVIKRSRWSMMSKAERDQVNKMSKYALEGDLATLRQHAEEIGMNKAQRKSLEREIRKRQIEQTWNYKNQLKKEMVEIKLPGKRGVTLWEALTELKPEDVAAIEGGNEFAKILAANPNMSLGDLQKLLIKSLPHVETLGAEPARRTIERMKEAKRTVTVRKTRWQAATPEEKRIIVEEANRMGRKAFKEELAWLRERGPHAVPQIDDLRKLTAADLADVEVPLWLKLSLHSAEADSTKNRYMFNVDGTRSTGAIDADLSKWDSWEAVLDRLHNAPEDARSKEAFYSALERRLKQYRSADGKMTGLIDAADVVGMPNKVESINVVQRERVMGLLKAQGREDLAEQLELLGDNVTVVGRHRFDPGERLTVDGKEYSALSELEIGINGTGAKVTVPVLGEGDLIHTGGSSRNAYTMRKQFFVEDLMAARKAVQEGTEPVVRAMRGDTWALRMLSSYLGDIVEGGEDVEAFADWLNKAIESASTWDVSRFRPDRKRMTANKAMYAVRRNQAMVQVPEHVGLLRRLGLSGEGGFIDEFSGALQDTSIVEALRRAGYIMLGSESSARKGVFDLVSNALGIHYGSVSGHFGKPLQFMRDPAKPFFVKARKEGLVGQWLPFATDRERELYRPYLAEKHGRFTSFTTETNTAPLVSEMHGLHDREIQFFKDYVEFAKAKAAGQSYTPVMDGIGAELEAFHEVVSRHGGEGLVGEIEKLAGINEGVNALAIEEGYEMVNTANVALRGLNQNLLSDELRKKAADKTLTLEELRAELEGREFDAHVFFGWDARDRSLPTGTYSGSQRAGKVKILGIGGNRQTGFNIQIEEGFDVRHAKFGNIFSKTETRALDVDRIDDVLAMLRELRVGSNGPFQRLYANQSVISLLNVTRRKGVAIGFTQIGDIGKLQGPHQFAADTLMSRLGEMTPTHRANVQRRLEALGIRTRRNERHGNFEGTLLVKADEETFKRRLLQRALRSDAQREKMVRAGLLESVGGKLQVTESALSRHQVQRYNRINTAVEHELFEMLENPTGVFGDADYWASRIRFRDDAARETFENHLKMAKGLHVPEGLTKSEAVNTGRSYILGLFGINRVTTSMSPWSSVDSNVPKDVAITIHDFMFYKRMGWNDVYEEMMGRRAIYGDMAETQRFYDVYNRMADLHFRGDPQRFINDAKVYNLDELRMMAGYDIEARRPVASREARLWRNEERFQGNFIIDLSTANKVKSASEDAVRKALGLTDLRIVAPGVKTDLWGLPYMTLESGMSQPEKFVHPLEELTNAVSQYYATGNEVWLEKARVAYANYHIGIGVHTMEAITGRHGVNPDLGPSIAGIVQYRDYYHQYKDILPDAGARRVVGVSEKTFAKLKAQVLAGGGSVKTFTGRSGETVEALIGLSKRFPITDVGPAYVVADKSLNDAKHGIALDEYHRTLKQLDWDGDTLYLHVLMKDASIKNILPELEGTIKSTAESTLYREVMRQSKYFNGAKEEMSRRVFEGTDADAIMNIAKKINPRLTSIADLTGQQVATKYFTTHIGRYSNLSRALGSMSTAVEGQTVSELAMRMGIAKELEQMSIDFGKAGTRAGFDPTALARQISEAMEAAASGSAADANDAMHRALQQAGLLEAKESDFAERSEALRRRLAETTDETVRKQLNSAAEELQRDHDQFTRIAKQFFGEHFDDKSGRKILNALKAVMFKPETLHGEETEEVVSRLAAVMHTVADASEHDIVPGYGSMVTTEALTESNAVAKRIAAALKLIGNGYGEEFHGFFRTEGGKAVAGLTLGSLALGAAVGLLTPATRMGEPHGRGPVPGQGRGDAAARIQRTPDSAMVGVDGQAPMPGPGGGNLRGEMGPIDVPVVQSPVLVPSRRFYYQQSNRMPRVKARVIGDPRQGADLVARAELAARDSRNPTRTNVNINMSPNARRRSDVEVNDDIKNRLYG